MNTPSEMVRPPVPVHPPVTVPPKQALYWSVRRELWENRSIYMAPLAAAGVVLFGFGLTALKLPRLRMNSLALEPTRKRAAIVSRAYTAATRCARLAPGSESAKTSAASAPPRVAASVDRCMAI